MHVPALPLCRGVRNIGTDLESCSLTNATAKVVFDAVAGLGPMNAPQGLGYTEADYICGLTCYATAK
eukprot:262245-Karenia_brevis.AAC.1